MKILALNLGLKSVRAIVFDEAGQTLASNSIPVETTLKGSQVEQDPEEWWEKLCRVIRTVCEDRALAAEIGLATVTCSASCLVAVDERGRSLRPTIMVSDRRAEHEARAITELPVFARLAEAHGLKSTSSLHLPRILWIKRNEPLVFAQVHKFLSPNDFLIARLSGGVYVTDTLNAGKAGYLPELDGYPDDLLRELGIEASTLPEVVHPGSEVCRIAPDVARQVGLSPEVRLRLSTYDAVCSTFGSGLVTEGMACDVSGTVSSVRVYSQKARRDKGIFCQQFEPAGCYFLGGSNNLGGGLIEWAKQCFYPDELHPYEVMENEARASTAGAKGLIFLPYLLGARAPRWNDDARGVFFGLERFHTRGDMARAIFESAGFCIREFTDIFERIGVPLTTVAASGGLARISLINEVKADVTGIEYRVTDEFESSALGAALIVLVAEGVHRSFSEACAAMVRTRHVFLPKPKNVDLYRRLYTLYVDLYDRLGPSFREMRRIKETELIPRLEHIRNL